MFFPMRSFFKLITCWLGMGVSAKVLRTEVVATFCCVLFVVILQESLLPLLHFCSSLDHQCKMSRPMNLGWSDSVLPGLTVNVRINRHRFIHLRLL